jgi:hypothetical protein
MLLALMDETERSECCDGPIAVNFTQYLLQNKEQLSNRGISKALHEAVNDLRMKGLDDPLAWVPFIHLRA